MSLEDRKKLQTALEKLVIDEKEHIATLLTDVEGKLEKITKKKKEKRGAKSHEEEDPRQRPTLSEPTP